MTKKLFVTLIAFCTVTHLSGCSSSGSSEDGQVAESNDAQFSQESDGDFAQEGQGQEGNPQDQLDAQDGQQSVAEGQAPTDQGQDLALQGQEQGLAEGQVVADAGGQDELSLDDPQPLPEDVASSGDPNAAAPPQPEVAPPPASEPPPIAENAPPPTDEPLFKNDAPADAGAPMETAAAAPAEPAAPKVYAPLQKVKDSAFEKNGANLNRVYVARQGDTLKAVAQRLDVKQKELKSWNPILSRGVKTGDKIYYPSKTNPEDTRMLTYYEDKGIQPSIYVSKEGDNIRKLSKQLLGNGDSWKEVWSTNASVESKGDIPAGLEIKYWPEGSEAIAATPPPANMPDVAPPMDVANNMPPPDMAPPPDMMPPPPPPDMAMNSGSPAPASTPDTSAMGQVAPPPDMAPPPPPPPPPPEEPRPVKKAAPSAEMASEDPDTMMAMGLGGILLMAAAVLFVVLRKNRAKRVDLGQTQV